MILIKSYHALNCAYFVHIKEIQMNSSKSGICREKNKVNKYENLRRTDVTNTEISEILFLWEADNYNKA